VLAFADAPALGVYVAGDTVWYEGVAEVAARFSIAVAVLNLGAARVPAVGPAPLTMTAADAVETAHAFPTATLVPLHFEGWAHFSESRAVIEPAFAQAGLTSRVVWLTPGVPQTLHLEPPPAPARME
jgi:L-ascorbate metabolism protein UlaG (beta-lactamase superfamily)